MNNSVQRVKQDLIESLTNGSSVSIFIKEDNLNVWMLKLDVPYEEASIPYGYFYFELTFGSEYPKKSPALRTLVNLPHSCVVGNGFICLDMLKNAMVSIGSKNIPMRYETWSPAMSAYSVLMQIQDFFNSEYFSDAEAGVIERCNQEAINYDRSFNANGDWIEMSRKTLHYEISISNQDKKQEDHELKTTLEDIKSELSSVTSTETENSGSDSEWSQVSMRVSKKIVAVVAAAAAVPEKIKYVDAAKKCVPSKKQPTVNLKEIPAKAPAKAAKAEIGSSFSMLRLDSDDSIDETFNEDHQFDPQSALKADKRLRKILSKEDKLWESLIEVLPDNAVLGAGSEISYQNRIEKSAYGVIEAADLRDSYKYQVKRFCYLL